MKTIRFTVYTALAVLLLASCSTLEMISSTPNDHKTNTKKFYIDSDSEIRYMVSNDRDTLHLRLVTSEQSTISKMLRQGTKVYFNLEGKKKKKVYVQYPLMEQAPGSRQPGMKGEAGEEQGPDPSMMLDGLPRDILFVKNGLEELIQPSLLVMTDIHCKLRFDRDKNLVYDLKIPFYRISEQGLTSIEQLSIGVVTTAMGNPGSGDGGQGGGMGGGRSGGMGGGPPGGGMGGGSMGGGRGGGMGGGGRGGSGQGGMERNAMSSSSEFWFLVDLYRE